MNKKWYFTADLHVGHSNIVKYCNRPFMSTVEKGLAEMVGKGLIPSSELRISPESTKLMSDTIIDNINATVGSNDILVIAGDFCWTSRDNAHADARKIRDRINCGNITLILGNHDNRKALLPLFDAIYDQYLFNIDGQNVFVNHYPMKSWNKSSHGSYCLTGHTHGNLSPEDDGELLPYDKKIYTAGFDSVLESHGISDRAKIIEELLAVAASTKGIDLHLDIGVDNPIRKNVPFGTPWSMLEIHEYMYKKKDKWLNRKKA